MRPRAFIQLLGGVAVARPLAARAQGSTMQAVRFLNSASLMGTQLWQRRSEGGKETGYAEDQNVTIEYRWADNQYERLSALAAGLVNRRVNVIFANNPSIPAALAATKTFIVGCCASKDEPDDRNGLLRPNGHRLHRRATEKRDEIAAFHVRPSHR
jgi:hypothetical protein